MGVALFANNAVSTLAADITSGAVSLSVAAGQGALFPSPSGGDYFLATLAAAGAVESAWEIVKVTARSTDTFTIVRAQEGTSAAAWTAGSKVELRWTAGSVPQAGAGLTNTGQALAVTSIPNDTLMSGDVMAQIVVAPATPGVGFVRVWTDSTTKLLSSKDDTGLVAHVVRTYTGGTNQFVTAINADGSVSHAQVAFSNLSGTATVTQGGTGADLSATGGASMVVFQETAGGALTVRALTTADVSGLGTMATQNATSVAITGGAIDGTPIGQTTKAAGSFTSVTASSSVSLSVSVNGANTFQSANTSNGTAAVATVTASNDVGVNLQSRAYGSGNTATAFGLTLANYVGFFGAGASLQGILIGQTVSAGVPIIFGLGTSIVGRFTSGTLTTGAFHVYYTGDATSSTAAGTILDGGLAVAKTLWAATIKADNAIAIAYGGTGQTTKAAAFDALQPMSHAGALIIGGTAGTGTELVAGTNGNVLTMVSGSPAWQAPSGGSPSGAAGGSLAGTYPNPTIASSVNLPGAPTVATAAAGTATTQAASTAFVQNAIGQGSGGQPLTPFSFREVWFIRPSTSPTSNVPFISGINISAVVTTGTVTMPAITTTNLQTSARHINYLGGSGTNLAAGVVSANPVCWRGNAAQLGGFYGVWRWSQETNLNGSRAFYGLSTASAQVGASAEPSVSSNHLIGVGFDAADSSGADYFFYHGDGTTMSHVSVGASMARDTTTVWELVMWCLPNDSQIWYRITNLTTGAVVVSDTSVSSNIPAAADLLYAHHGMSSGSQSSQVKNDLYLCHVEVLF